MIGRIEMEELDKFQKRMNRYGLEVNKGEICKSYHQTDPGFCIVWMSTRSHLVKGNKKLIDQLRKDGYHVKVFRKTDYRTYADYMVFQVSDSARIKIEEDAP